MSPGPAKQFDVEDALAEARDLFWRRGFDGTGVRDLEVALGIGRKSLYDTFGSKRALYLRALEQYGDTVITRICRGLEDERNSAFQNLERVLGRLQAHHGSGASLGCLLGVAMGQAGAADEDVAEVVGQTLQRLERAFEKCLRQAREDGAIRASVRPRDAARQLVALIQGMALLGRIDQPPAVQASIARAALEGLRTPARRKS